MEHYKVESMLMFDLYIGHIFNVLYLKFHCSNYDKHPKFFIPSWSNAGDGHCTVNEALWVRILDSEIKVNSNINIGNAAV